LLTRELWNTGAGLLSACFIAIIPGYISRSVAGSYDNEGIAIFALMFTYYLWVCNFVLGYCVLHTVYEDCEPHNICRIGLIEYLCPCFCVLHVTQWPSR
jgi:hypothetical protein